MVDTQRQPGFDTPGARTPGATTPGSRVPNESAEGTESVTQTGVAIDATGTTTIGTPGGHSGRVEEVLVDADAADFDFNVEDDSGDLFTSEQSPSGTSEESFVPDDTEQSEFDGSPPSYTIDISSASGTGGATADVTVVVAVEEQQG